MNQQEFIRNTILKGLIGSASSGATELALFPLENIRIRLQLSEKTDDDETQKPFHQELIHTLVEIIRNEGITGLYSGLVPYLIYNMVKWGGFFSLRDVVRRVFIKLNLFKEENQFWRDTCCNYVAGVLNVFLICPLSVIFSVIVSNKKKTGITLSMFEAASKIFMKNGLKGFYSGIKMSLILVLNPTLNLTLFSMIKKIAAKNKITSFNNFTIGAFTKLISTLLTFPLSTIKVNQQGKNSKKSIFMMILTIIMRSGIGGFYKGLSSKILKSVLQNGLMLFFNEKFKKIMGVKSVESKAKIKQN